MSFANPIRPLDELHADFELELAIDDPTRYTVIGARDFVLGSVSRLLVDTERQEVVYLVVNTRISNFPAPRGEERLVPLDWVELVRSRRQCRMSHLSRFGFRELPLYEPGAPVPASVPFPRPSLDDPDLLDIA